MSDEGERALKIKFHSLAKDDFMIHPDVRGEELLHHKKVVIDFMLYPMPHLIKAGFDPVWFGIEVKHFGVAGETGKMSRFIWQSISYVQSKFQVDGKIANPAFVLGYSDVFEVNDSKLTRDNTYMHQLIGMLRLAGLAHVGTFRKIKPTKSNLLGGWDISFSSSSYFRRVGDEYTRTKYNIFKENVGNSSG
ncbi:MAG: hypothetical protein J0M11_12800 [Anaerolineae bacterium]|nr:hypothetical protein [Anaerolineae bacterium]